MLGRLIEAILSFFRKLFGGGDVISPPVVSNGGPAVITPVENTKKALIVGINDCGIPGAELNGCVNDAQMWWELFTGTYGFDPDNVRVVTDERATKPEILRRLSWLIDGAKEGDELVYCHSGHGSQIRDRNADELDDQLDELVIAYGHTWDDPLLDDDIALAFEDLPEGAFLTMLCDTCHSGSMSRGFTGNPVEWKPKFLAPPFDIASRSLGRNLPVKHIGMKDSSPDTQRHILLSGCKDDQTSADALMDGKWGGALTVTVVNLLKECADWDWLHIHEELLKRISSAGFSQTPQLSGMTALRERVPFGGPK